MGGSSNMEGSSILEGDLINFHSEIGLCKGYKSGQVHPINVKILEYT